MMYISLAFRTLSLLDLMSSYGICVMRKPRETYLIGTHMSNTHDQIPVDKTWSPTESSRKMKPEVQ